MALTSLGYIYLPIALWCFFQRHDRYLLALLLVSTVLQAASVVNISVGVQAHGLNPFICTVGLLALKTLPKLSAYRREIASRLLPSVALWLGAYLLWAAAVTLVMPLVFEGLQVRTPYDAYTGATAPLRFSLVNAWHIVGLCAIGVMFAFPAVRGISGVQLNAGIKQGLLVSFILVACANLYEQAVNAIGLPSLVGFWASNPGYNQIGAAHSFGWHSRVGVPFTEPSYASAYIVSLIGGGLMVLKFGHGSGKGYVALFVAVLALLSTGGSTGMVAMALLVAVIWLYCLLVVAADMYRGKVILNSLHWVVTFGGIICVGLLVLWPGAFGIRIQEFISGLLVDKLSMSNSGTLARLSADIHGFKLLKETYGLGVGLGSNRTSSFLSSLFVSLGLVGVFLFFGFVFQLIREYVSGFSSLSNLQLFALGSFPMMLLSLCLSIPDLNLPALWACLLVLFLLRPTARV